MAGQYPIALFLIVATWLLDAMHGGHGMPSRACARCRSNFNGSVDTFIYSTLDTFDNGNGVAMDAFQIAMEYLSKHYNHDNGLNKSTRGL